MIVVRLVGGGDCVRPLDDARRLGAGEPGRVGPVVPGGGRGGGLGGEGRRGRGDVGVGPRPTAAAGAAAAFLERVLKGEKLCVISMLLGFIE